MGNGIEVRFKYGGMSLVCDDEAFARLRDMIGTEAAVADATGWRPDAESVRGISIRSASAERISKEFRWFELVLIIPACCISGIVNIVGLVTIVRWVMRHFA